MGFPFPNRLIALGLGVLALGLLTLGCGQIADQRKPDLTLQADLIADFHFADVKVDSPNLTLLEGWAPNKDGKIRWSLGDAAEAQFVVLRPRPLQLAFKARPLLFPGSPTQTLTVALNGRPAARIELSGQLDPYRIPLPIGDLISGQNHLQIVHGYHRSPREVLKTRDDRSLAVAWADLAIEDPANQDPANPAPTHPPRVDEDRLALPAGSQVDFYVEVAGPAELTVSEWQPRGGSLEIFWWPEGGVESRLTTISSAEHATRLDLPIPTPQDTAPQDSAPQDSVVVARLRLRSLGDGSFVVHQPRLWVTAPKADTVPSIAQATVAQAVTAPKPHVLIYLIDTLRADHLGCYGYPRPISPRLDAFAANAVLFENVVAQSSWTRSSVASLFTGLGPLAHGALKRSHKLSDQHVALAEILRDAGWDTAAFVTNPNVTPAFGFEQGFDHFEDLGEMATSDLVTRVTTQWLDQRWTSEPEKPLFLYVHTMDPHDPYEPPPDLARRFASSSPFGDHREAQKALNDLQAGRRNIDPGLLQGLRDLYDAEIAANDRAFGELVDFLVDLELYDDMWIIVVSDHGEEFHDHGHFRHGRALFEESVGVPLIIKPPAASPQRVSAPVQHIDLLPTLLSELNLTGPPDLTGRHLLRDPPPSPLVSYLHLDGPPRASVRHRGWKLVARRDGDQLTRQRLYHLPTDPDEGRDLADSDPLRTGFLTRLLREHLTAPAARSEETHLDPELQRRLEALGYLE